MVGFFSELLEGTSWAPHQHRTVQADPGADLSEERSGGIHAQWLRSYARFWISDRGDVPWQLQADAEGGKGCNRRSSNQRLITIYSPLM